MNWLAHLYLSDGSNENMLGNLLGDFISNVDWKECYSEGIQRGIRMHFAIDNFTDTHPLFHKSSSRISEKNRRYAGVMIDIFYDHFLAKNWSNYSDEDLEDFTNNFYRILERNFDILPPRLAMIVPYMTSINWLFSYREISSIEIVLERISHRFKKTRPIDEGIQELTNNYSGLEEDFSLFFPELIAFAAQYLREQV